MIRQLDELLIAGEPERWAALGLAVGADGVAQVGTIRLRLGAPGEPGIAGWRVRGLADGDLDGLPTQGSAAPPRAPAPAADHPLGALAIDHVVVATPDLERTIAALERAGLELRRVREAGPTARQGFFVVGDAVLEVVGPNEPDGQGPRRSGAWSSSSRTSTPPPSASGRCSARRATPSSPAGGSPPCAARRAWARRSP